MSASNVNSRSEQRSGREFLVMFLISSVMAILIIQAGFEDAAWAWKLIAAHLPI